MASPTTQQIDFARQSRAKRLADLNMLYGDDGIWAFDVDRFKHPRKKLDLLETAQPAVVTGYLPWPHENGVALKKVVGNKERQRLKNEQGLRMPDMNFHSGDIHGIYQSLLNEFDYRYEKDDLLIYWSAMGQEHSETLEAVRADKDIVSARSVTRIERQFDNVAMWDRQEEIDLFHEENCKYYTAYGVASLVRNDEQLLRTTGSGILDTGAEIEKISISLRYVDDVDETERVVQGIYKNRYVDYDAGLFASRGEQWPQNKKALAGTALKDQPWDVVLEYLHGTRTSPLW